MNSHEPPSGWQELRRAPGKALATPRTMAESFGRGLRDSPGPSGESGAAQPPMAEPVTVGAAATERCGDRKLAQLDHGPSVSPRCARTRHEYTVSYSISKSMRCAPVSGLSP